MATSAAEMLRRLNRITETMLQEEVEDIILTTPKLLKEAKEIEFLQGRRPDKKYIGNYRNPDYAEDKNMLNPIPGYGHVDLIVSGRFVNNLYPYRTRKNRYLFANRVDYGVELIEKYGKDILGLNQNTFFRIQRDYYKPHIIKFIKKQLGV